MDFEIGDVVELKSGGPRMTIVEIGSWNPIAFIDGETIPEPVKDEAMCFWFQGSKKFESVFNLKALNKI